MTSQEQRKLLLEEVKKLYNRLDLYEDFLTAVITSIETDSDYTEAYVKAMKCALETFNKLFEREVKKDD